MRIILALLLCASFSPGSAQSPTIAPSFEVSSIKPADPASRSRKIQSPRDGNSLTISGLTLKELILFAYGSEGGVSLAAEMLLGAPGWLDDQRYDVVAKASGRASQDERREMLKSMLVERCHLTVHYEARETAVYVLAVAKGGPKMKARRPGDDGEPFRMEDKGAAHFIFRDVSLKRLAAFLESQVLGRRVIDSTELSGTFDFELSWNPDETQFGGRIRGEPNSDLPDLWTAMKQIGLRLETAKAPVPHLVIDRVEKPSGN